VHLVWQDAYPPAICVRILEIRRVKQSVLGYLHTYVCEKNICVCYWYISNTNLEKICHFPELRIYQKYFILSNFYRKICKKCANSTKKSIFKQGQTISSWILVFLCVCPTISTALKVFGPKKFCAYFRNPQGQTISSWILAYLCVWKKYLCMLLVYLKY